MFDVISLTDSRGVVILDECVLMNINFYWCFRQKLELWYCYVTRDHLKLRKAIGHLSSNGPGEQPMNPVGVSF